MASITASAAGGNWSAAATWTGGVVPGAGDDVFLASTSGSVTVDVASSCRNLDCTGYTHTLTLTASLTANPTAGGTIKFVSTMTLAGASTLGISVAAGASALLTSAGKTPTAVNFTGSSTGGCQLQDALTVSGTVTLTQGKLDTNGQTCNWGSFSSNNSNTRTLTMGASAITITGAGTSWTTTTGTGLTITANTATVTMTGAGATFQGATTSGFNWQGLSVTFTGSGIASVSSGGIFANVTRTGTAARFDALQIAGSPPLTITGALAVNGNSVLNRVLFYYGTVATLGSKAIAVNGSVTLTNVDVLDITAAGSAPTPWTGTSLGDCGGNSGITFAAPVAQTWTGNTTGNWSDSTKWTSRVPLPQDDVSIPALSTATITVDMPRMCRNFDMTGSTGGTISIVIGTTPPGLAAGVGIHGNVTLAAGSTYQSTGGNQTALLGHGAQTIRTNGVTITTGIFIASNGGSYTLLDPLTHSPTVARAFQMMYGTFDTAGFAMTTNQFYTNYSGNLRTVNLRSSTVTITLNGNTWNCGSSSQPGLTFNAGTSTIVMAYTGGSAVIFNSGGAAIVYNNVTFAGGSAASFALGNVNIAGTLTMQNGGTTPTLTFPAGFTVSCGAFNCTGSSGTPITINSSTPGTQTALNVTGGFVSCDYVNLTDSGAGGGAIFYAGAHSTNTSNNANWIFDSYDGHPGFVTVLGG